MRARPGALDALEASGHSPGTMTAPAGLPISLALARLRTRDDVYLDGVFAEPPRRSETALVWVHGLDPSSPPGSR